MNRLRPRTNWSPRRTKPHFARVLITDRRLHLESAGRAHTVPLHIYLRTDGRRFPPRERRARTRCTIRGRVFAFDRVGGCITAMIELPIFGNSSRLYGHVNRSCKMLCLATTRRSLAIWSMNLTIGRHRCIGIRSRKTSGHDASFSCSSIVQANLLKDGKKWDSR